MMHLDENKTPNDDLVMALQKSRQLMALLAAIGIGLNGDALVELAGELATDIHYAVKRIH